MAESDHSLKLKWLSTQWDTNAAGKEKVILTYPRWTETKVGWLPTERSYFLSKLEPLDDCVDFKAFPRSHTEKAAPKNVRPWRGNSSFSSNWDDE